MPGPEHPNPAGRPPVSVEIDELVLHGFPLAQRDAIAAAFGDRLVELIREHGAPAAAASLATAGLDAGAFTVNAGAAPAAVGRAAAESVYRTIRGGDR